MLGVCLLGPVNASVDEVPLRITRPLERALLARLALSPGVAVEGPRLLDELWTAPPERGLAALHTLVYRLRRTLGAEGPACRKEGSGYALLVDPGGVDICRFEELAARGRATHEAGEASTAAETLGAALGLWRGPALADIGDVPYALPQRARLEELRLSVLEQWVQANLDCGRHNLVVGELETALVDQPLREGLWANLMLALYRCGRQGEALHAYQRLRLVLGEELGVDPSAPLVALEEAVLQQSAELDWVPPSSRSSVRPSVGGGRPQPEPNQGPLPLPAGLGVEAFRPFVSRTAELELAERLLLDPTRIRLGVLWILGEPGIGKTRLATDIGCRAHSAGAAVLFGRCNEDLSVPYQPFLEALQWYVSRIPDAELEARLGEAPAELIRLVPEIGVRLSALKGPRSTSPEIDQHRLFEAVRTWLAAPAQGMPLVVVLDDVHWATRPTLALLGHVARSAEPSRALLICTARNTSPDDNESLAALAEELERRGVPNGTLELAGLGREAVGELVESAAGRPLDDRLWALTTELHSNTAGNPLFIDALLTNLLTNPQGPVEAHRTLAGTVGRRVARQPAEVAELLRTAAVAGLEFDLRVVARAAGLDDAVALDSFEAAGLAGLVDEEAPNHYRFRHALVRSALREQLSRSRLVRVHAQIGEALETVHRDHLDEHAGELAYHFVEAIPVGAAAKAYRYTLLAAQWATRLLSHEEAVEAYGQALELLDEVAGLSPLARYDLLIARGEAQRKAGDLMGALITLRAAAAEADAQGTPEQLARAAVAFEETNFWLGSSGDDALGLIGRAEEALPVEDSPLRALTVATLSRALNTSGRMERVDRSAEAVTMADRLGDPVTSFAVLFRTTRSSLSVEQAHVSAARWTQLWRKAREIGDWEIYLLALAEAMWARAMLGDLQTWDDLFAEYARLATQLRQPRWEFWLDVFRAFRAVLNADLEVAEHCLERAERIGEGFGWAREGLYGVAMFLIRREQGRLLGLTPVVEAAVRLNPSAPVWRPGLAALYTEMGQLDDARREFRAIVSAGFAGLPSDGTWDLCVGLLAEVCAALGDAEQAPLFLEHLRACEGRFLAFLNCAGGLGPADRLLGMLASVADRPDDAERWHRSGLELARRVGSPLWIAHCLYDYAVHLLPSNRSTARRMLAETAAICDEHGLVGLGHRVDALQQPVDGRTG